VPILDCRNPYFNDLDVCHAAERPRTDARDLLQASDGVALRAIRETYASADAIRPR
jgi:hypothetical protein